MTIQQSSPNDNQARGRVSRSGSTAPNRPQTPATKPASRRAPVGHTLSRAHRPLGVLTCVGALLTACAADTGGETDPQSEHLATAQDAASAARYTLRIHAILAADDDGNRAATATPDQIAQRVAEVSQVYEAQRIALVFDPQTDVTRANDTRLNRDCILEPEADLSAPKDQGPQCESTRAHQNEIANGFPGKLVWLFNSGDRLKWDNEKGWQYKPRTFLFSNSSDPLVFFGRGIASVRKMAHETGHYLHLAHPFKNTQRTVEGLAQKIKEYVEAGRPREEGLNVFDGDGLSDTAPELSERDAYHSAGLDACTGTLEIPVNFSDGTSHTYQLGPATNNVMGYIECGASYLSPQQGARVLDTLENNNRNHLIMPRLMYTAVWELGDRGQTRALRWSREDFAGRFNRELAAGQHVTQMQAYDRGDGTVRYNGVWEAGPRDQTFVLGATLQEFADRFDSEIRAARNAVHVQAYIEQNSVKFDGIWEAGDQGQTRAIQWSRSDFLNRNSRELAQGKHLEQVQAYTNLDGAVRYVGVWERGCKWQRSLFGATLDEMADRRDRELAARRHFVHLQAYVEHGETRYDAVWQPGGRDQSVAIRWALKDFIARDDREAEAGRRLVHMQAYDRGDGVVRYDGVWEAGGPVQRRTLSESLSPFADRFDELTAEGYHAVITQAHYGR